MLLRQNNEFQEFPVNSKGKELKAEDCPCKLDLFSGVKAFAERSSHLCSVFEESTQILKVLSNTE